MAFFRVTGLIPGRPSLDVANIYELDDYEASVIRSGPFGEIRANIMFVNKDHAPLSIGKYSFGIKPIAPMEPLLKEVAPEPEPQVIEEPVVLEDINSKLVTDNLLDNYSEPTELLADDNNVTSETIQPMFQADYETETKTREDREQELEAMQWREIKSLGEQKNIDYTNKQEVIDKILVLEYDI